MRVENTLPLFGAQTRTPKIKLRWYQRECCECIVRDHETYQRLMIVLPTGCGKTVVIGAMVRHWVNQGGRVLVMAHRDELVEQLHTELERATGLTCYIEQADLYAPSYARIVVASVQSLTEKRLERFDPGFFTHMVTDECHHYTAHTYKRPILRFSKAKLLGVTATPKRSDRVALGKVFEHVAYDMTIEKAIDWGYLVPVEGQRVEIEEIHLTEVKLKAGDYQKAQLDLIMLQAVEGIIKETLRLEPHRQGIGFFPGVDSAQAACDRMNALKPNSACMIHGGTDKDLRRELVRKFKAHVFQYLFNCNIATEGFDAPSTDLIIGGRPTMSWALYLQMIGRGTRPEPGVIDRFELKEQSAERRAAIAASDKPNLKVLDFVGNSAAHDLAPISVEDMLGGDYSDRERKLAKTIRDDQQRAGEPVAQVQDALREARQRLEMLEKVQSQVTATVTTFDPFNTLGIASRSKYDTKFGRKPATDGQKHVLKKAGLSEAEISAISKREASALIDEIVDRRKKGLCTLAQLRRLEKFDITEREIGFQQANKAMLYLRGANPAMVDRDHLRGLLGLQA